MAGRVGGTAQSSDGATATTEHSTGRSAATVKVSCQRLQPALPFPPKAPAPHIHIWMVNGGRCSEHRQRNDADDGAHGCRMIDSYVMIDGKQI